MHGDSEANAAQAEYWNSEPGRTWIDMESALDASMAAILDLVIARADPRPGEHVLDIGCGTGASTLRAAAAVGGGGRVLGADISGLLLARARARAREARLENASFEVCDAQVHDFPPAVFDLMLSRFGVMFFGEPVAAFRNIARALRPASPDAPPGAGWPIGHRAELSRWRRVVATMYDTVVPTELSAASPPTGEDIAEGASERLA